MRWARGNRADWNGNNGLKIGRGIYGAAGVWHPSEVQSQGVVNRGCRLRRNPRLMAETPPGWGNGAGRFGSGLVNPEGFEKLAGGRSQTQTPG